MAFGALVPSCQRRQIQEVQIDGSSTVAPVTQLAAELFRDQSPDIHVTVGTSGTGGGFKKFLDPNPALRTDLNDASRPISPAELKTAESVGVEFIELPIAIDGIAIVVHPSNTFCQHMTVDELKRIWAPGSAVTNWKHVREGFPDLPLKLYGPGTDSGTFDYFTEVICGKAKASRADFAASENDNQLVQGVSGDPGALGYFGFSYYETNHDKLRLVAIDGGDGVPVRPDMNVIRSGRYRPLSRPLYIYVNRASADRPAVAAFVRFMLENAEKVVEHPHVNYVALPRSTYADALSRFESRVTGPATSAGGAGVASH
jgi:phosphate transport system substrate-binding protein